MQGGLDLLEAVLGGEVAAVHVVDGELNELLQASRDEIGDGASEQRCDLEGRLLTSICQVFT